MSIFDNVFRDRRPKKSRFGSEAAYKRTKVDDDEKEKLTPREFGRRVAVGCTIVMLCVQCFRVYLKRHPPQDLLDYAASLPKRTEETRYQVACSDKRFSEFVQGCSPSECDRYVISNFIQYDQIKELRDLAEFGMTHGGGAGGATILDFPSGALSYGEKFIDVHQVLASKGLELPMAHTRSFLEITRRVRELIMRKYGLDVLYPTTPRFFSRMDGGRPAKTQHDEYWHNHIDAQQYPGFEYTALLYLNEQGKDYKGGEFSFVDHAKGSTEEKLTTLKPEPGKLVVFTSGSENVHRVHQVTAGKRYALTVAFTCDKGRALEGTWAS
mmetsp:Transcript_56348/g.138298  ORF Transcript_56348/g.138298 Transcript_56348/m.138298 type:complete len:325 (-) Transcript_56348:28-1002(-)